MAQLLRHWVGSFRVGGSPPESAIPSYLTLFQFSVGHPQHYMGLPNPFTVGALAPLRILPFLFNTTPDVPGPHPHPSHNPQKLLKLPYPSFRGKMTALK